MTIYVCRVLTPEFKEKFDAHIQQEVEQKIKSMNIKSDNSFRISWETSQSKSSFYFMWNNNTEETYHEVKEYFENGETKTISLCEYYKDLGLWEPQFNEFEFEAKEVGLQSQPRIEWENKITKIDEIDEIIGFRRK